MKKAVAVFTALIMAALLAACGAKKEIAVDIEALGEFAAQNIDFGEALERIDSDYALELYCLDAVSAKAVAYSSSGAVADTFAAFEAENSADVPAIRRAVDEHLAYLNEGYSDYGPAEVPKIENAVIIEQGNYVILCICADSTAAREAIEGYINA